MLGEKISPEQNKFKVTKIKVNNKFDEKNVEDKKSILRMKIFDGPDYLVKLVILLKIIVLK